MKQTTSTTDIQTQSTCNYIENRIEELLEYTKEQVGNFCNMSIDEISEHIGNESIADISHILADFAELIGDLSYSREQLSDKLSETSKTSDKRIEELEKQNKEYREKYYNEIRINNDLKVALKHIVATFPTVG